MIGSIVTTVKGHLQGTMENDICVWRGVRYAKAPIDGLRFRSRSQLIIGAVSWMQWILVPFPAADGSCGKNRNERK